MKTNFIKKIKTFIAQKNLTPDNSTIIIGLSGGPDSVFLLHILATFREEKNLTLIAAHLDHGWRPESANDAQFCNDLAAKYSVSHSLEKLLMILILVLNLMAQKKRLVEKRAVPFLNQSPMNIMHLPSRWRTMLMIRWRPFLFA